MLLFSPPAEFTTGEGQMLKLSNLIAVMLVTMVFAIGVVSQEKEIRVINADRCLNGRLATEAYQEIAIGYELNIRTWEFALKGLKKQDGVEGVVKAVEQLLFDTYAARAFLEQDYRQYMKDSEPLRSWIPPFRKECR